MGICYSALVWLVMITSSPDGILLEIRVIPRARKSAIAGIRNNAILVRLNAPPVDGAANAELVRLLADMLGIAQRNVQIVSGEQSRGKRVRITGRTVAEVERLLDPQPSS
jgi:uncharacterized protein